MAEEVKQTTLDPEDGHNVLIEAGMALFSKERIPTYEGKSGQEDEVIFEMVYPLVESLAFSLAPLVTGKQTSDNDNLRYLSLTKMEIPALGKILDTSDPLTTTRRGDMWPDTFDMVLRGIGDVQVAENYANQEIGWADWITRTAQDIVLENNPSED